MLPDGVTRSTAGPLARRQFRAWADLAAEGVYPVGLERDGDPDAPFPGEMRARLAGDMYLLRVRPDGHRARRGPAWRGRGAH